MYVQRLMMGVLGIQLSEENDTVRRYVVTHHDPHRNLLFHPVLLEKLHKSNDTYSFDDYVSELNQITGASYSADAWREVSTGSLKKKDKKFKVYLGLCKDEKEDPADYSVEDPPILDVHFARETWIMPNAKYKDYKLAAKTPSDGPWWARFVTEEQRVEKAEAAKGRIHQPYTIPIASEPVIQRPPSLRPSKERLLDPIGRIDAQGACYGVTRRLHRSCSNAFNRACGRSREGCRNGRIALLRADGCEQGLFAASRRQSVPHR